MEIVIYLASMIVLAIAGIYRYSCNCDRDVNTIPVIVILLYIASMAAIIKLEEHVHL
jgi:hypothetical protein